ncbi:hypothetical protein LNK15_07225, partial [Jeotgalicoccus huakuii]|nr:hypothetical protein [Jeotgalicoccus huakuii]
RMSVRGHDAVHNELGIALMAVNLRKYIRQTMHLLLKSSKNGFEILNSRFQSHFIYSGQDFCPNPFLWLECLLVFENKTSSWKSNTLPIKLLQLSNVFICD